MEQEVEAAVNALTTHWDDPTICRWEGHCPVLLTVLAWILEHSQYGEA